jgi:hypothetical protein
MTETDDPAELPITWALFTKLEMAPMGELEDAWDYYDAAVEQVGEDGLLRGWALVAAVLRKSLQDHAAEVGCDCGSDAWLAREQIFNAHWAEGHPDG